MAALESLQQSEPQVVESVQAAAGLSLGEYTAFAFAGGVSFEDGLNLVRKRGQAMQQASEAVPSGMVSVLGLQREQVQSVCDAARNEGEIFADGEFFVSRKHCRLGTSGFLRLPSQSMQRQRER